MKKKSSKSPSFKVLLHEFDQIKFVNIFELPQFAALMKALKKLKKKLYACYGKDDAKFQKIVSSITCSEAVINSIVGKKGKAAKLTPEDLIEHELRNKCMYFFWAKCEYEVVVTGWPNTDIEKKIDVYLQLAANWDVFKQLVFEAI